MKNKIKDYIDLIFADAPDCGKTREMKEEMYANVSDRYDDLISEGKSPSAAYNISISGIGDISELVDEVRGEYGERKGDHSNPYSRKAAPSRTYTEQEKADIEKYRIRRGVMNSVAIALYILCWVPIVILGTLSDAMGANEDIFAVIGITVMMIMITAATVLMIMKSSIKPICLKGVKDEELDSDDEDDDDDDDDVEVSRRGKRRIKNPVIIAISTILWALTVVVYISISFSTGAWHITWLMFLITTAIDNIIEAIFELCGKKYL